MTRSRSKKNRPQRFHKIAACPLAFGEVGVKERVKDVLNFKKPAFWIVVVAVVACIVVAACFLKNPSVIFRINETQIEKVIVFNKFIGEFVIELSDAQISEMVGRFSDVQNAKRSNKYEGLTPGYQLCVFMKDGSYIYANGYNTSNDMVEIVYANRRYKISDDDFRQYLNRVCSGKDVTGASYVGRSVGDGSFCFSS